MNRMFLMLAATYISLFSSNPIDDISAREPDYLSDTLSHYQNTSGIKAQIKKNTFMQLLGKKTSNKGSFIMFKNNLRINFDESDKKMLIINDRALWLETRLPKALGGEIQVTKTSLKKAYRSSGSLLAILFGREHFMAKMKVTDKKNNKNTITYSLKPRASFQGTRIKTAQISVDKNRKWITEINYSDDIGNKTTYSFKKIKFSQKYSKKQFKYSPPKGAKVTEF